jgi:hypothetical protein
MALAEYWPLLVVLDCRRHDRMVVVMCPGSCPRVRARSHTKLAPLFVKIDNTKNSLKRHAYNAQNMNCVGESMASHELSFQAQPRRVRVVRCPERIKLARTNSTRCLSAQPPPLRFHQHTSTNPTSKCTNEWTDSTHSYTPRVGAGRLLHTTPPVASKGWTPSDRPDVKPEDAKEDLNIFTEGALHIRLCMDSCALGHCAAVDLLLPLLRSCVCVRCAKRTGRQQRQGLAKAKACRCWPRR